MKLKLRDEKTGGDLLLFKEEDDFDRLYFSRDRSNKYFTIVWNYGQVQIVTIDGTEHEFYLILYLLSCLINHFILKDRLTLLLGSSTVNSIASLIMTVK
jgi:hypothetical protein